MFSEPLDPPTHISHFCTSFDLETCPRLHLFFSAFSLAHHDEILSLVVTHSEREIVLLWALVVCDLALPSRVAFEVAMASAAGGLRSE